MLDLIRADNVDFEGGFIFKGNAEATDKTMGTVRELVEKGVKLKRSFHEVSFKDGVLKLCSIYLSSHIERLFANIVIYEKLKALDPYMISYLGFMNCLIDKAEDVEILRKKGIIYGWMGSDEMVAGLFNRLVKQVLPPRIDMEGKGIDELLVKYCSKRRHRWWAS